jgi:hypothetical protein
MRKLQGVTLLFGLHARPMMRIRLAEFEVDAKK